MKNYDTQYPKYSYWKHVETGNLYRIINVTNVEATKKNFPLTIVYEDKDHKLWSRSASSWDIRFKRLEF